MSKFTAWNERRLARKAQRREVLAEKLSNAKQRWDQIPVPANYFIIVAAFAVFSAFFQIFFWSAFVSAVIEPWINSFNWSFDATWNILRSFRNAPMLLIIIPAVVCAWKGLTAPLDDKK